MYCLRVLTQELKLRDYIIKPKNTELVKQFPLNLHFAIYSLLFCTLTEADTDTT